jgi:hypothetical protein
MTGGEFDIIGVTSHKGGYLRPWIVIFLEQLIVVRKLDKKVRVS